MRAREFARRLGKPVRLWISDKQDAFVKGIAREFPGVPHRYCVNHFLRDLGKPVLQADSHAKVQMRKKVRGLRAIEREALTQRTRLWSQTQAGKENTSAQTPQEVPGAAGAMAANRPGVNAPRQAGKQGEEATPSGEKARGVQAAEDCAAQVVLDYCAVVRGILNDDQGGPLHPPGMRMAEALAEVRASLQRNLELNKPGPAHGHLQRLAGCIDRGLQEVKEEQEQIKEQVEQIRAVAETLKEDKGTRSQRKARYEQLRREYEKKGGDFTTHLAKLMRSFAGGLFVRVRVKKGEKLPTDNDDLEQWFRKPKGHARRIHGRKHAGMRIVQEGPTLLQTLNAHETHPEPFTAAELLPYWQAAEPADQREAIQRRKIMRKARSKKSANGNSLI